MLARSTARSLPHQDHHHQSPSPPPRATAFSALPSFLSFHSYELISLFFFSSFFFCFFVKNLVLILSLSLDIPFLLGSPASISSTRLSLPRSSSFRSSRVNLVPSTLLSLGRESFSSSPGLSQIRRTPRNTVLVSTLSSSSSRTIRIEERQGGYCSSAGRKGRPTVTKAVNVHEHLRTREDESLGNRLLHARPH